MKFLQLRFLPRVMPYLKAQGRLGVLSGVLIVAGTLAGLAVPWPMKFLVDNVLGDEPIPEFLAFDWLVNEPQLLLVVVVGAGFLLALLQNALSVLDSYVNTRLEQNIVLHFRGDLFEKIQRLSMAYHDRRRSGMKIYVINSQGDAVARLIMAVPHLGQSLLTLIGMFWICYTMDPLLALVSLAVVPFIYYCINYYATHIQKNLMEVREMEMESLSIVHEAISMIRVIVAFCREGFELSRFRKQGRLAVDARVVLTVRQTLFSLVVNGATALGTALVLGLGAYRVMNGELTVGLLLVVMTYIASVYKPIEALSSTIGSLQQVFVSLKTAFEILDTNIEIADKPDAIPLENCRGEIKYENVNFHYEGRKDTLRDINFEAKTGQVVAVVGQTGAGKTTLLSLLPRFYSPNNGRVLVDGHDTRDLTLESLRQNISMVLQDPVLFSATVADNIRYGRLDASMDEIIDAAKSANAHDFIMRLPKKYETQLGERGAQLSTGERQRISVARAFLKDAPILILDEPTSSIDVKTESVILDALDRLMEGRTTFIIAHRLSTIRHSDKILVIEQGRLVEQGSHDELMELGGMYRQLHDIQMGERRSRRFASEYA